MVENLLKLGGRPLTATAINLSLGSHDDASLVVGL
jgi:hypothetical protein